jgi:hypothetical protein
MGMRKQKLLLLACGLVLASLKAPAMAAPGPKETGPKAGNVSALLPLARINRGEGKALSVNEAKKGDDVQWNDLVKTDKGGRARITLLDQSILSLGSQAELRVVQHDQRTQQSSLSLTYGRMRAEVTKITRDGGSFQVRTPTAVAGVIGTDFATYSSVGQTEFVCLSGIVEIGSADPSVPDKVQCGPGMYVKVEGKKAPTQPKRATIEQIAQAIQETEPAKIASFSPASVLAGTTIDAVATGAGMAGINKVAATGGGADAKLNSGGGATHANVHIVADGNAAPGPRVLTLTKSNGEIFAAVLMVLGAPGTAGGDPKQAYLYVIESERQSAIASLNGLIVALQQAAGQGSQQLDFASHGQSTSGADSQLQAQVDAAIESAQRVGTAVNRAAATAAADFERRFAAAQAALAQRNPTGTPDDTFTQAVKSAFDEVNATMMAAFTAAHDDLGDQFARFNDSINNITRSAVNQFGGPSFGAGASEKSVELGAPFTFTAGGDLAGATSYQWSLCSATGSCTPLPGFNSASAELSGLSCSLAPGDYTARLVATDSGGTPRTANYTLHVLAPAYDDPVTQLSNLAAAYSALQPEQFLRYFDPIGFTGFTALSENIRRTFVELNSMNINLRPSQSVVNCNDATLRADWEQNYTFKENTNVVFHQTEQLTARLTRYPGRGWFINDFQGDSGTVQGVPPGPIRTDNALPELRIEQITTSSAQPLRGTAVLAARGRVALSATDLGTGVLPISPGVTRFVARVRNVGTVPLTQPVKMHFSLIDANGVEIGSVDVDIPVPLGVNQAVDVSGVITVPQLAPGSAAEIVVISNPGCIVQIANCGSSGTATQAAIIGRVDLAITSITGTNLVAGEPGVITVTIQNTGDSASSASSGNLLGTDDVGNNTRADIPSIAAGASATVIFNLNWPTPPGPHTFTARITPAVQGDSNAANDSKSVSLTLATPVVDLQIANLALVNPTQVLVAGQSRTLTFSVTDVGNAIAKTDNYTCTINNGVSTSTLGSGGVPQLNPNTSVVITVNFIVPANQTGNNTITCTVTQDAHETVVTNNSQTITAGPSQPNYIPLTPSIATHGPSPFTGPNALIVGEALTITVPVQNVGSVSATSPINVTIDCFGPVCGFPQTVTIAPPAAGQTSNAVFNFSSALTGSLPPGSYTGVISLSTATTQSNTTDDTENLPVDIIDFALSLQAPNPILPEQNIPIGGVGQVNVQLTETGPASIPIALSFTPTLGGVTYSVPSNPMSPGTQAVTISASNLTSPGPVAFAIVGTSHGVTRNASQPLRFFSASLVNISFPGNSASFPIAVDPAGTPRPITLQVNGNWNTATGNATLAVIPVAGFTVQLNTGNVNPGDQVTLTVTAQPGAPTTVTAITLQLTIPGTNPAAVSTFSVYVIPQGTPGAPDLQIVGNPVPAGSSTGRNYSTNPWLAGETVQWGVTVKNHGNQTSTGNEEVDLFVGGFFAGNTRFLSPLAPGAQNVIIVSATAPDPIATGLQSFEALVTHDATETNTSDNIVFTTVAVSDWQMLINGIGSSSDPVEMFPPSLITGSAQVHIQLGSGSPLASFALSAGLHSTGINSANPAQSTLSSANSFQGIVNVSEPSNQIDSLGYAQVVAALPASPVTGLTARRGATIVIRTFNTPSISDTVLLTSSANNFQPVTGGSSTPLQVNGLLPVHFTVTPSRSGQNPCVPGNCPGHVDLSFTDDSNIVVGTQQLKAIPYLTAANVQWTAFNNPDGTINAVASSSTVSAQVVAISARQINPPPDPVNTIGTLRFNIGDLAINSSNGGCIQVSPGGSGPMTVSFVAINGFNLSVINNWAWSGLPSGVSVNPSSGSGSTLPGFTFNNSNLSSGGLADIVFVVGLFNGIDAVGVSFHLQLDLSSSGGLCPVLGLARGVGGSVMRGDWGRSGLSSGMQLMQVASGPAPDLSISAADVSFTPSMPKPGETVEIRFRMSNSGNAAATQVPVALQVNGMTVASDTFDVGAGKTVLGGLQWQNAHAMARVTGFGPRGRTTGRGRVVSDAGEPAAADGGNTAPLNAELVIDPQHTIRQRTASTKSVALARLALHGGTANAGDTIGGPFSSGTRDSQRVKLEVGEASCLGFRFAAGAGSPCEGADVEFSVQDMSAGRYEIASRNGIIDLGVGSVIPANAAALHFADQASVVAGHTYAVQLSGGRVATITVQAIHNPQQLMVQTNRKFRGTKTMTRKLGEDAEPVVTGDTSGTAPAAPQVTFELLYTNP